MTEKRDAVIEAVREDLHRRSQLGIKKYGTTLAENKDDHRAKLQHAYEEALDLANYLKWAILELDHGQEAYDLSVKLSKEEGHWSDGMSTIDLIGGD